MISNSSDMKKNFFQSVCSLLPHTFVIYVFFKFFFRKYYRCRSMFGSFENPIDVDEEEVDANNVYLWPDNGLDSDMELDISSSADVAVPTLVRLEDPTDPRVAVRYCFTHYPETEEEEGSLLDFEEYVNTGVCYIIYSEEVGGTEGRWHLQGYLECSRQMSKRQLRTLPAFGNTWFRVARGSREQNESYCSKLATHVSGPYSWGTPLVGQGRRSDLSAIKRMIDDGANLLDVAEVDFSAFCRYNRGFQLYKRLKAKRRDEPTECVVIVGPSGSGKSRHAFDMCRNVSTYVMMNSSGGNVWMEQYDGEHTVVWDEFYGGRCRWSTLLQMLDRYPCYLDCKGSSTCFNSKRIIFTSNQHPKDWYDLSVTHATGWNSSHPLYRRIRDFGSLIITGDIHCAPGPSIWTGYDGGAWERPVDAGSRPRNIIDLSDDRVASDSSQLVRDVDNLSISQILRQEPYPLPSPMFYEELNDDPIVDSPLAPDSQVVRDVHGSSRANSNN